MGEIKSTLDLVMEKTKHLTLSDDEKADQHRKDLEQKIKGLISKFQDGGLTMDRLERELQSIQIDYKMDYRTMVEQETINRLDVNSDNKGLIRLLRDVCGVDIDPIVAMLDEAKHDIQKAKVMIVQEKLSELKNECGISGSAVVPNLEADGEYALMLEKIKLRFRKTLDRVHI